MTTVVGMPIVEGNAQGTAIVTDHPLSFWGGLDPRTGEVIDRQHPLSGRCLTGCVLSMPTGRGSCSASGVLLEAIRARTAPAAVVLSRPDPVIALGAILGEELYGWCVPLIIVDEHDRITITDGEFVRIEGGTISVAIPETLPDSRPLCAATDSKPPPKEASR